MASKKDVGQASTDFTDDVGIPDKLIHDGAGEMTGRNTDFQKEIRRLKIMTQVTERGRHNQNHRAEGERYQRAEEAMASPDDIMLRPEMRVGFWFSL